MIITRIDFKKNEELYRINCLNKEILTSGDFYADIDNKPTMKLELPMKYRPSIFSGSLEEIKFYCDEGETITIENVYFLEDEIKISVDTEAVTNLTIKGKEYKIEGVNGRCSFLSSATEKDKKSCLSPVLGPIDSNLRGLRGMRKEEIFAICYTIDTKIKQIDFTTVALPFIVLPSSYKIGEEITLYLYANENNYNSIVKFLDEKVKRPMFKGMDNYYSLEEIHIVSTTKNSTDGLYVIHIKGKIVYRTQSTNPSSWIQQNKSINSFNNSIISNKVKEKKAMNITNIFGTNDLGKVNTAEIKYSIKGIAFRTEGGTYCTYDVDTLAATDVNDFIFDIPIFILPAAIKDIQKGDIIYYNKKPYIVRANKENCIAVINPIEGKLENLVPKTSILGFSFYAKVFCPFSWTADNSTTTMNNWLPLLLMEDKNKNDSTDILMLMSMINGGNSNFNSFLPFMLMSDKSDKSDMMMMLMMMNNNSFAAKADKVNSPLSIPTPPLNYSESSYL